MTALAPALRVLLGCATKLVGDADDADVVRIDAAEGKVQLATFEGYTEWRVPSLTELVHVDLRRQRVTFRQFAVERLIGPLTAERREKLGRMTRMALLVREQGRDG